MARKRWRVGDIFTVPTNNNRIVLGQAIDKYHSSHFVVIFEGTFASEEQAHEHAHDAIASTITLAAICLDGKIYNDMWKIIDRADPAQFDLPAYKLGVAGHFTVQDFHATQTRKISDEEAENLTFRPVTSGAYLERIVNASLDLSPWEDDMNKYRPGATRSTREMF